MTEQSREYGEGLYALCAEEALSGDVLEQLDVLNAILESGQLSKETEEALRQALESYTRDFLSARKAD